jgi:hypothetical protein
VDEVAVVRELNAVPQQQDQVDPSFGKPLERRVGAVVEVLGLEDVIQREPAGSSSQWRSLRTPMRTVY